MSFYLATFEKNWADEFDVAGFAILRPHEMRYINAKLNEYAEEVSSFQFGSNQSWDDITYGEIAESINFNRISKENYNQFKRMGLMTFGYNVFEILQEDFFLLDHPEEELTEEDFKQAKVVPPHETNTDNPIDFPKPDPLETLKKTTDPRLNILGDQGFSSK